MLNHKFLTPDFSVEQTEFSSGVSVIVNFSQQEQTVNNYNLPPKSFIIID